MPNDDSLQDRRDSERREDRRDDSRESDRREDDRREVEISRAVSEAKRDAGTLRDIQELHDEITVLSAKIASLEADRQKAITYALVLMGTAVMGLLSLLWSFMKPKGMP